MSIVRIDQNSRYSHAVIHGGFVFTAGQVDNSKQDVPGQTGAILSRIDALLNEVGTNKESLISANVWLSDMSTYSAMNEVWESWIAPGCAPARATVESNLAAPEYKVEIAVVAAVPDKKG
jgi:enamine deaminase RidA (YjgF/YER057c/UK114 family)